MDAHVPAIELLGVPLARLTPQAALVEVERLYERGTAARVFHANVHTLNLAWADEAYRAVLRRADLVLNDGKGVMLGALLKGERFPADLNGNFFTPLQLSLAANRGWGVFFLGAKPGVAERAAARLERSFDGLRVLGVRDGYFSGEADKVMSEIRDSGAAVLLVGMGNPLQEKWIDEHLDETGARLAVGVGAFFDFVAGEVPRAPAWMSRVGLEWVYRLGQEPRRMWRRYLVGNPAFVVRVLGERRRRGVPSPAP